MAKGKKCCECESDKRVQQFQDTGKYYCTKHYLQMQRYGKILTRTIYDPNEFVLYDDYAEIILYNKQCDEIARATIDIEDIEACRKYKWCITNTGYTTTKIDGKIMFLHWFVLNHDVKKEKLVIDHIDRQKLNNRKYNLRVVTYSENLINKDITMTSKRNSSGCRGVSWEKERKKWVAYLQYNKQYYCLGYFDEFPDAVKARQEAEEKYCNKPTDNP